MNRTVIVTGATGNMGKAVIEKFVKEGDNVFTSLLPGESNPFAGVSNPSVENIDLQDERACENWVSSIIARKEQIDIAVLTVGGFASGNLEETSYSDIDKQIQLNFRTAFNTAKPVFLKMKEKGNGRIFLVGSKPGLDVKNAAGMVGYGLSKSLIFRLAELLNHEAKGSGVVTSIIVPSTIDTPQNRESMPDADFDKWVKPGTFADIVFFYASEKADGLREPVLKIYNNS